VPLIQAGAGISDQQDGEKAAHEAATAALERSRADAADWVFVFVTPAHRGAFGAILETVCDVTGTSRVIGCTGVGVLAGAKEIEGEAGVAVLAASSEAVRAVPLLFRDEGDGGLSIGYEIAALLEPPPAAGEDEILLLFSDPARIQPERVFRALGAKRPILIAGAAASEDGTLGGTQQFCGREVAAGAVAGLHLSGRLGLATGVTQGCTPIGEPCVITRGHGNMVFALDGRPALAVFAEQIPRALFAANPALLRSVFVGISPEPAPAETAPGEFLVRPIAGFDQARGAFAVGGSVVEGQWLTLVIRDPDAAREDLKRMLEKVRTARETLHAAFGLYFNCAGRGRGLYGLDGIDSAYLTQALGSLPLAGVFGNAEFAPLRGATRMFTYTGVLTLVGEARPR